MLTNLITNIGVSFCVFVLMFIVVNTVPIIVYFSFNLQITVKIPIPASTVYSYTHLIIKSFSTSFEK